MPLKILQRTAFSLAAIAAALLTGCHAQTQVTPAVAVAVPATPLSPKRPTPPMKPFTLKHPVTALLASAVVAGGLAPHAARAADAPVWVTGYYMTSNQTGALTPDKIDYSAITHLVHFSIIPKADGTIAETAASGPGVITPQESADVITHAHKAGVKVIVCLGGANSGPAISAALGDSTRGAFVQNLVKFVQGRGYDGLDIDMEPITPADEPNFMLFVPQLRAAMKAANPKLLLTIPASGEPGDQPKLCAALQDDFDQINIQTYDLSGTWPGWKTWYNGSLYGEGKTLLTPTRPFPGVDEKVGYYTAAGIPKSKLGIGIAFYGYVWSGANGPNQDIQGVKTATLGYNQIMDQLFQPGVYHWDAQAHAPYLAIGAAADPARKFVSYDDTRLAREKVLYTRTHGLGGVIIWELGDGYRPAQPAAEKDKLLDAVKAATHTPLVAGR